MFSIISTQHFILSKIIDTQKRILATQKMCSIAASIINFLSILLFSEQILVKLFDLLDWFNNLYLDI